MKNEEFGCAMQACRKVILHSSFLVLHFDKLSFKEQPGTIDKLSINL